MTLLQVHIPDELLAKFRTKHKGHMNKLIERWIREDLSELTILQRLKKGDDVGYDEIIYFLESEE